MKGLEIGDRVKVISVPDDLGEWEAESVKIRIGIGMTGTVKRISGNLVGVEFDDYIGGHSGFWEGKDGYCWYVLHERLEKIEETYTSLFPPKYGEDYFYLNVEHDEDENTNFYVLKYKWKDDVTDYGMLALGNVFGSKEEALKNKDKLLEKMDRLREGEQI